MAGFFSSGGELKIKTAEDLVKVLKGEPGVPGIQGGKGDIGEKGDKGDKGEKGDKGDQGLQGPQGIAGIKGDRGEKGDRGDKGPKGDDGLPGVPGIQGVPGPRGDKGDKGDRGEKGDKGDPGEQGIQGLQGLQGPRGEKGDKGDKGDTGAVGKDAPLSSWVKVVDLGLDTTSAGKQSVFSDKFSNKILAAVKVLVFAKAPDANVWIVGEKLFTINPAKQSMNVKTIVPEEKTHSELSFGIDLTEDSYNVYITSLEMPINWKVKLEVYSL